MSETLTIWWALALGLGLGLILAGLALFIQSERAALARARRMSRASGGGEVPETEPVVARARPGLLSLARRSGERLAVVLGGEARETAADLATAGFRGRDALLVYAFLKTVLPLAAVVAGLVRIWLTVPPGATMAIHAGLVIAAALALSKAVDIWVDVIRRKRLARVRRGFPDLLELLVITSEAGLGPQPALHRVAQEMARTHPDLSAEVLEMVSEMRMTNDRRQAYARLTARLPLPEIATFTQTLDQSDTYGTPFSRAMRTLIGEARTNHMMQVEEQAARLPVLMTVPLIFCIMPAVFVVLVGPAALSVLDNIVRGG